jgi:hypothetical protein
MRIYLIIVGWGGEINSLITAGNNSQEQPAKTARNSQEQPGGKTGHPAGAGIKGLLQLGLYCTQERESGGANRARPLSGILCNPEGQEWRTYSVFKERSFRGRGAATGRGTGLSITPESESFIQWRYFEGKTATRNGNEKRQQKRQPEKAIGGQRQKLN